jgi:hypothetical protein
MMLTSEERHRVTLAIGDLLARGLLVTEDDPELAAVRVDGRGYRYHSRFWALTGVLEVDGRRCRVRLQGGEADRARQRVAQEWITAGAPDAWARTEANKCVRLLVVHPEKAAQA